MADLVTNVPAPVPLDAPDAFMLLDGPLESARLAGPDAGCAARVEARPDAAFA